MSTLCEEFGCLPSQLRGEDPEEILTIAGLRSYARAKMAIDKADPKADQQPSGYWVDRVWEMQIELVKEHKDA